MAITEAEQTPEFYLGEARASIARRMVERVEYRGSLVEEIIRLQESLRVSEGLLSSTTAEVEAMQAALDIIPTHG